MRRWSPHGLLSPIQRLVNRTRRRFPTRTAPLHDVFAQATRTHVTAPWRVETPETATMTFARPAQPLRGPTYEVPADYVATLPRAIYCPNNHAVMGAPRTLVAESLNNRDDGNLLLRDFFLFKQEFVAGYGTLLRSRTNNYYHTLLDNLPRLLALDRAPYRDLERIQLLHTGALTAVERFFLARLCPPNVVPVSLSPWRRYEVEHLLLTPFKTRPFAGYLPAPYARRLRSKVLPARSSRRNRRILISREHAPLRRLANREALLDALTPLGFESVVLEALPPQEQIALFYDAEVVVGAHGAGLANLLFANPLPVVELFPSTRIKPYYYYLSKSRGHRYACWCGTGPVVDPPAFEVDVHAVLRLLADAGLATHRSFISARAS